MLENFIYSEEKALFLQELEASNIPEDAIVFIKDTKEIYTHGTYFGGDIGDIDRILDSIINT